MSKGIDKMCLNKRLYITKQEALNALKRRQSKTDKMLRVYKCPICKGYHLTSKRKVNQCENQ